MMLMIYLNMKRSIITGSRKTESESKNFLHMKKCALGRTKINSSAQPAMITETCS